MKKILKLITTIFPKSEKFLLNDTDRAELMLKLGLGINAGYAIFKLSSGIFYRSFWFGAVGVYYILLCSLKFYLLHKGFPAEGRSRRGQLVTLRNCSVLLLLLNLTMSFIIFYLIKQNKGISYSDFILLASSLYTLFRLVAAFSDIVSFKRLHIPVLAAAKSVSMSVALMSLFSLQVTLLDRIKAEADLKTVLNILSGSLIIIAVISIAVTSIVKAEKEIREKGS